MSKPSFFVPATEQKRSASPTRDHMHREAFVPVVIDVERQDFDPRAFALAAIVGLATAAIGAYLGSVVGGAL